MTKEETDYLFKISKQAPTTPSDYKTIEVPEMSIL